MRCKPTQPAPNEGVATLRVARLCLACLLPGIAALACTSQPPIEDIFEEEDIEEEVAPKPDVKKDTLGGFDTGSFDTGKDTAKPDVVKKDTSEPDTEQDGGVDAVDSQTEDTADAGAPDVVSTKCKPNTKVCDGTKLKTCNGLGDDFKPGALDCAPGTCNAGACTCKKGQQKCVGGVGSECSEDLSAWIEILACNKGEICKLINFDGTFVASCAAQICVPAKDTCSGTYDYAKHAASGDVVVKCNKDGTVKFPTGKDCTKDKKVCVLDVKGVGTCQAPSCGDGKLDKAGGELCDLGMNSITGKTKNGAPGALCTKDCKIVESGCKSNAECAKLELGPCDLAWTCNQYKECVPVQKPTGDCDDGNPCTIGDKCILGGCVGEDKPCTDDNPCTADSCDVKSGCKYVPKLADPITKKKPACNDGEDCTVGDTCTGDTCKPGKNACDCNNDKECNKYDTGDLCTGSLICKSGSCVVADGTAVVCGKGVCVSTTEKKKTDCDKAKKAWIAGIQKCHDPAQTDEAGCTKAKGTWVADNACRKSTCSLISGACEMKLKTSGTPCNDDDACTKTDQCFGGFCAGDTIVCNDNNPCTTDLCHKKNGCIFNKKDSKPGATFPCDDGDACTNPGGLDSCKAGQCAGVNACECKSDAKCASKGNKCSGKYKCELATNKCKVDPKTIPFCDPKLSGGCQTHNCDLATGKCKLTYAKAGAKCSDDDACTIADQCVAGGGKSACKGEKNTCEDGNACTTDQCDPLFGCNNVANNNPCNDGNPCTEGDKCVDSQCWPGTNACQCFVDADCFYLNAANKCLGTYKCNSDISKCHFDPDTVTKCGAGVCSDTNKQTKKKCDQSDGAQWTPDSDCAFTFCVEKTGVCQQKKLKDGVSCNDGSPCTTPDLCAGGKCTTKGKPCDDSNACTKDSCDPSKPSGCVFDSKAMDAQPCNDGDVCNGIGACKSATCEAGKGVKDCNDGNSCTADGCDAKLGCYNLALPNEPCSDGDYCTGQGTGKAIKLFKPKGDHKVDLCDAKGVCVSGDKLGCDDGNACTKETCKAKGWSTGLPGAVTQSCEFVSLSSEATCISGNKCTTGSVCNGSGGCNDDNAKAVNCDDGNACTNDSCIAVEGCKTKGNEDPCDDGNACTIEDQCVISGKLNEKGTCFSQKPLDCNDENLCTKDSCDSKTGCKNEVDLKASSCGEFATCTKPPNPYCAFKGNTHLMISEIYIGDPVDPSDDFIEIYNPTLKKPKVGAYELQWRPKGSKAVGDWALLAKLPAVELHDYGYLLAGNTGPLPGGIKADVQDGKNFKLDPAGMQVRIFDVLHTLSHDTVTWGLGKDVVSVEGQPLKPWFSARSVERKASLGSKASTMVEGGTEWYAGNAVDSNNNAGDFIVRLTPEPQGLSLGKVYEPACKSKCAGNKICDWKGAGKDSCVLDAKCAAGCGAGKKCQGGFGICVPDFQNKMLISEIGMGIKGKPGAEFIELYNGGSIAMDISGYVIDIKAASAGKPDAWTYVTQIAAKTVILPKRFYMAGTKSWAATHGGVDAVIVDSDLGLDPAGGSLRLYDPRVATELDKFGWGTTKEYDKGAFKAGTIAPGTSVVRKANDKSTGTTMAPGGKDFLAGHAVDKDMPNNDFVLLSKPSPWSNRSGAFAPSCGGGCTAPAVCNFAGAKGACVDPTCGGKCLAGSVCNLLTGKCDLTVLISQYQVYGLKSKHKKAGKYLDLAQTENEWIELYNPGPMSVSVLGMLIQYKHPGAGNWSTRTDVFVDDCKLYDEKTKELTKQACPGPGKLKCFCQNDLERDSDGSYKLNNKGEVMPRECIGDSQCRSGHIPGHGYLLISGPVWDVNLPQPTWSANAKFNWAFEPGNGALRLVRGDGSKFPLNKQEADRVGWGIPGGAGWCGPQTMPAADAKKPHCTFMRKPWAGATAEQMSNPLHPAYYGGSALKTDGMTGKLNCQKDMVMVCPSRPRNLLHPPQKP